MNQKLIAGIGNIYADEILFKARVMPNRPAESLAEPEVKNIFAASESIFKKAIKYRGTTISDYVDTDGKNGGYAKFLKVYGRKEKKCHNCAGVIRNMKIAGRSSSFCEVCQK